MDLVRPQTRIERVVLKDRECLLRRSFLRRGQLCERFLERRSRRKTIFHARSSSCNASSRGINSPRASLGQALAQRFGHVVKFTKPSEKVLAVLDLEAAQFFPKSHSYSCQLNLTGSANLSRRPSSKGAHYRFVKADPEKTEPRHRMWRRFEAAHQRYA